MKLPNNFSCPVGNAISSNCNAIPTPRYLNFEKSEAEYLMRWGSQPFTAFPERQSVTKLPSQVSNYTKADVLTQNVGAFNLMFIIEVIDLLSVDLVDMLRKKGIYMHRISNLYKRFRIWKTSYDKALVGYLQRMEIDFDEFCERYERFYELTVSKSSRFTSLLWTTRNMHLKGYSEAGFDISDINLEFMAKLSILGVTFSIYETIYNCWYAYFVMNCPDVFMKLNIRRFNINEWIECYNGILPELCIALNIHQVELNIKDFNLGVQIYANDLRSVQKTFEALDYLEEEEHDAAKLGIKFPPLYQVRNLTNVRKPFLTTVEDREAMAKRKKK